MKTKTPYVVIHEEDLDSFWYKDFLNKNGNSKYCTENILNYMDSIGYEFISRDGYSLVFKNKVSK